MIAILFDITKFGKRKKRKKKEKAQHQYGQFEYGISHEDTAAMQTNF